MKLIKLVWYSPEGGEKDYGEDYPWGKQGRSFETQGIRLVELTQQINPQGEKFIKFKLYVKAEAPSWFMRSGCRAKELIV